MPKKGKKKEVSEEKKGKKKVVFDTKIKLLIGLIIIVIIVIILAVGLKKPTEDKEIEKGDFKITVLEWNTYKTAYNKNLGENTFTNSTVNWNYYCTSFIKNLSRSKEYSTVIDSTDAFLCRYIINSQDVTEKSIGKRFFEVKEGLNVKYLSDFEANYWNDTNITICCRPKVTAVDTVDEICESKVLVHKCS